MWSCPGNMPTYYPGLRETYYPTLLCPGNLPKYYPGLRDILPDRPGQDYINIIIILSV